MAPMMKAAQGWTTPQGPAGRQAKRRTQWQAGAMSQQSTQQRTAVQQTARREHNPAIKTGGARCRGKPLTSDGDEAGQGAVAGDDQVPHNHACRGGRQAGRQG